MADARGIATAAVMAIGCASAPPPQPAVVAPVTTTLEALEADSVAEEFIARLMASESRLEEPDSLYAVDALVLADGEARHSVPRLAGVGLGGTLQLVTTWVAARGAFVWGVFEYRWLPMFESDAMRMGVATVVIARLRDGNWRVVHLHSSSPAVPQAPRPEPPDTLGDPGRGGGI